MDWSRTKTIFIITFLLLNIFLTWQLIETHNMNQISLITEATIQEVLRENNVTIEIELPEEESPGLLVVGKQVELSLDDIPALDDQEIDYLDSHTILSELEEPFALTREGFASELPAFLSTYVFEGDNYRFGGFDSERNRVYLYQAYGEKTAYTLDDEPLVLQLDEHLQIISYQQRYFQFEQQDGEEREMLSSLKAIEVLLNDQLVRMNQTISDVQFGYYSFFSPTGDVQVFAPMWRIKVDGEEYLVHAIGGSVQQLT
ncbi:two-component system regulatory protein YycI [Alkalihalobacillus sp. MEB130]|uniref:two-component system regulatory protein YycI n=1 Tax=Alkalihalobacillus sp. MEB130 TaxID=2976704 RepID=UPI0028E05CB5|nr:two-component system regulatory protein YycI [Alkalihalobacillus sp. MEB130]MDT8862801.1 two-component system regulatory protein YycI [Alkalihalobacillus sp. MEB130]